nr:hypothetical protein CFP56_15922 [Quercus suber]
MGAVVQKWVQQPGAHDDDEEGVPLVDVHDEELEMVQSHDDVHDVVDERVPLVDVHDEDHEIDDVDVVDEWVPLRVHRHDMKPTKRTNITMN